MFNKTKSHKALTLGDAVPAIIALALIAIVGAVALLILTSFQSNPVTTPSFNGGSGAYGLFIESNSYVNSGNIVANSPVGRSGQATGGAGAVLVIANSFTQTGTVFQAGGLGGDAAGGSASNTFNQLIGAPTAIPYATGAGTCGNNLVSTVAAGCTGNVFYTQSVNLAGNINVTGNIVINNGVILTTNGWNLVAGSNVVVMNTGEILTGSESNGGAGGSQTANGVVGGYLTQTSNSFGGGGAGGTGCFTAGGRGGNTITLGVAGGASGSTCTAGTAGAAGTAVPGGASGALTSANIILYVGGGQANTLIYLSGSGAGGSSPQFSATYNGIGNGVTGIGTILSFQSLLGLVVVAAIIIGVVVGAFSFGRGGGQSREEF